MFAKGGIIVLPQVGNKSAKIMFVLDPLRLPTSQTSPLNKSQLAFLGPFMKGTHLQPKDIYFVSACAPCEESIMTSDKKLSNHIKETHDEFMALVNEIKTKIIVALGGPANRQVFNKAVKVTTVRGVPFFSEDYKCVVLPTLGLLHVMKQPQNLPLFESDLQTFAKIVTNDFKISYEEKIPTHYEWCSDLSFLLKKPPENLSVDTENIGLYHYMPTSKVLTVQLTWEAGKGVSVPINYNPYDECGNIIPDDKWNPESKLPEKIKQNNIKQLKELLENPKVKCSGHNLKYDFKMLKHHLGIQIANYYNDTLDLVQVIDENMRKKSLDDCARRWVRDMSGYADEFNVNPIHVGKSRMDLVPPSLLLNYGCGDTDCQFRLRKVLENELEKDYQVKKLYYTIVQPAIRGFCDVELRGQYIDINALRDLEKELTESQEKLKAELLAMVDPEIINKYKDSGTGLSFNRAAFLVDILFKHPKGFRLKPKIYTKATQNEPNEEDRIPSTSVKQHLTYFADNPFIKKLTEYVQTQKMLGTYIGTEKDADDDGEGLTGFYKYICDGKIHPTFWLSRTVTGRSACLAEGTKISCVGEEKNIEDVKVGDLVYCYDKEGKLRIRKVTKTWDHGIKDCLEVKWQSSGNGRTGSLICTPNHPFMTKYKGWVKAEDLKRYDKIFHLKRSLKGNGRIYLYGTNDFYEKEEVFIKKEYFGSDDYHHIHHKDKNKSNNVVSNLVILTPSEHSRLHGLERAASGDIKYEHLWATGPHPHYGKENGNYRDVSKEELIKMLEDSKGHPSRVPMDFTTFKKKCEEQGIDICAICKKYEKFPAPTREAIYNAFVKHKGQIHKTMEDLHIGYQRLRSLCKKYDLEFNHTITSVKPCGPRHIYDIEVEEFHNFIANELCVHNSSDPNGQNIPKRGKLAKAYRKIFKAPPGYCLLQCDFSQAELRGVAMATHDPVMVDVYNHYLDIHTMTAAHNLGMSVEDFKKLPDEKIDVERYKAKAKNFGLTYGMQWRKFKIYAKTQYGIDYTDEEAQKECESWHNTYKNVRKWHARVEKEVLKTGYMRAFDGRIRHLPDVFSSDEYVKSQATRQAINSPIQSFASDMGLWAFARLHKDIPTKDMLLMGFIHDAILAYVPLDRALECAIKVKEYMESNPMEEVFGAKSPIPWVADLELGLDLKNLHKIGNPRELLDKGISKYDDVMKAIGVDERAPAYEKTVRLKVKKCP